ncbi:MAG: SAM-dependent methyltransferase [Demequinaceae bacterium]|nr:SAM-dependent methyltransferase [Demequinaceae bacterium]
MEMHVKQIGTVSLGAHPHIALDDEYAQGLDGLEGFSHVWVVWYAHEVPAWDPANLTIPKPYRKAPPSLGVFSTRSENRPNPILLSVVQVTGIDVEAGTVGIAWIDAEDGSPVLDLKPYQPAADRIRDADVPEWCRHWPATTEESGTFPWHEEFMF